MRKLTHEEFLNKFYEKNKHAQDIEILGTYINRRTKIKCKCKVCGHEWTPVPGTLLNGCGCPKCAGVAKLTTEEFINRLQQINPDIEVLGTYIKAHTKMRVKCAICGHEWTTKPYVLLQGHGCPKCGGKIKLTHEEFIQKLQQINPDIEILGIYTNTKTKIKCKCKKCGHEWEATPNSLLRGRGCPKCGKKRAAQKLAKTQEEFINTLKQINPDIVALEPYTTGKAKIKCRCIICEYEWTTRPNDLLRGHGCPKCKITKGEKRITQYLDNLGIDYIYDKPYFNDLVGTGGGLLRPDFIIPSLKIWIEYDGIQHFEAKSFNTKMSEQQVQEEYNRTVQNDQIKDQYAKDNNWILVRIPFTEYDNIEQILAAYLKQEQVI